MHSIFVPANDAFFEHWHNSRHQHVIAGIDNPRPRQSIKGILYFRYGVGSGSHAQSML